VSVSSVQGLHARLKVHADLTSRLAAGSSLAMLWFDPFAVLALIAIVIDMRVRVLSFG
jgi:hypothetical protein